MAKAQTGQMRRVGAILAVAENDPDAMPRIQALSAGLASGGWTVGKTVELLPRWTAGDTDAAHAAAVDLIAQKADVIVANGTPATAEAVKLTKTIPIVFALVTDPVGSGFVASVTQPGGNVTGYLNFEASLAAKWVQILLELDPTITRTMMVFNPDTAPDNGAFFMDPFRSAATTLGISTQAAMVSSDADIAAAVAAFAQQGRGAIAAAPDVFMNAHRSALIAAVLKAGLPAIYPYGYYATDGGLLAYGIDTDDAFRLVGGYAARILSGTKPSDLPVQAPTTYQFVINEKTAKAQGITIPATLLAQADQVIG